MRYLILAPLAATVYEAFVIVRVYILCRRNYFTKPVGCYRNRSAYRAHLDAVSKSPDIRAALMRLKSGKSLTER